jgi:hypothetical protein
MRPDQDRFGERGFLDLPGECSVEGLQPPEIVGQVKNPALEAVRRLWRAFDRVCYWIVLARLSIFECILGADRDPPTTTARPTIGWISTPAAKI